ncbi:hypothetical protein Tco_1220334 [Tanacetum coccineum]
MSPRHNKVPIGLTGENGVVLVPYIHMSLMERCNTEINAKSYDRCVMSAFYFSEDHIEKNQSRFKKSLKKDRSKAANYVQRPWEALWKSKRLMNIVSKIMVSNE